jgi:hypothetical protein
LTARTRWILTLVAGAAVAALAVWLLADGSDESDADGATTTAAVQSAPQPAEPPEPEPESAADPVESRRGDRRLVLDVPRDAYPVIWVRRGAKVEVRTAPGGGEVAKRVGRETEFGSPTVFGVVRESGGWAGVTAPFLPNNQLGWIRLDSRRLGAGWTKRSVVVDLSERRAVLRNGDELAMSFSVTIGMPGSETPTGRFAVTDTFRGNLNPAYGCCAVALSANQPHLPSGWLGGSRIAIHGTSGPLGVAASHGCVRAADPSVNALVNKMPLGAPVFIRG